MIRTLSPRDAVAPEHTWDAASIFPSHAAWEQAFGQVVGQLQGLERFRGRLGDGPAMLVEWFDSVDDLTTTVGKLYVYGTLFHEVNTADQEAAALNSRSMALLSQLQAETAFAEPELLKIGFPTLRSWMQQEPRLAIYDHAFDQLEHREAHVRSAEVEELLGRVTEPFSSAGMIHGILADADLQFRPAQDDAGESHEVAQGSIDGLLASPDRALRRSAWESYADAHLAHRNAMANCIATGVKQNVFTARARRYGSALEASLATGHIPTPVFHNLIATFKQHLPTWHRYWRIRRQALGYDVLHPYDIEAPLTANMPQVPFDQSVSWISEGMAPLGEEYVATMRRGLLDQRWVDIYPNQGKRMGAFSTGVQGTHPFILMSYNDTLFSTSTLAHELGHSMHSYYSWQTQPQSYSGYGMFVAEVASNFNQALVRAHLLNSNSAPDFQIAVIEEAMANFHRYFFIMPTLARFELEIHERVERGEALTAGSLIALMAELFREGYGSEVAVDEERVGSTWAQFSTHLYSNFYVFQYATGISAAHALAEGVLSNKPEAVERYLQFLKTGSSRYPLDTLGLAGVDMASPKPVEQTFAVLSSLVDRLEGLVGR